MKTKQLPTKKTDTLTSKIRHENLARKDTARNKDPYP